MDCGSPKPAPSRGISPLSRNQASPNSASLIAAQPAGSLPRPDLAAADGQQAGNEPDQVPGNVERDTIGDHAEPLPGSGCSLARLLLPGLRVSPEISAYVRVSALTSFYVPFAQLTLGGKTSLSD